MGISRKKLYTHRRFAIDRAPQTLHEYRRENFYDHLSSAFYEKIMDYNCF